MYRPLLEEKLKDGRVIEDQKRVRLSIGRTHVEGKAVSYGYRKARGFFCIDLSTGTGKLFSVPIPGINKIEVR